MIHVQCSKENEEEERAKKALADDCITKCSACKTAQPLQKINGCSESSPSF